MNEKTQTTQTASESSRPVDFHGRESAHIVTGYMANVHGFGKEHVTNS